MVQNRTRKTMRHFQCRDDLWGLFEKMAVELECSIDYLINEAMRQYARSRKYAAPQAGRDSMASMEASGFSPSSPPPGMGAQRLAPPPGGPRPSAPPPRPQPGAHAPMQGKPMPPPAFQGAGAPSSMARPQAAAPPMRMDTDPMGRGAVARPQVPGPGSGPPPLGGPGPVAGPLPLGGQSAGAGPSPFLPQAAGTVPTLYLIFNGQRIPITKEQFIIGRGLKTSDLAIKDGNISRKHIAIIYHNGAYYIKDLGSVNGIEFQSKRIDSKRIDEGDMFHICDYELKFTYK